MVARWRQLFSQGQVTSRSSGSQSTSLNHSGAMQASMISFYCSGLICHNINSFLSGMSAYYHMDLESFALSPKKGIEEGSPRILPLPIHLHLRPPGYASLSKPGSEPNALGRRSSSDGHGQCHRRSSKGC